MGCTGDGALVILPPPDIMTAVDVWRSRYDSHVHTIPPHITVAFPFVIKPEEWPDLKPAIRECLADFAPFSIVLQTTGVFESPAGVLWLRPDDGGVITAIRTALAQKYPAAIAPLPFEFIPHMTLGFFETPQALQQAREIVERELQPMRFVASVVSYLLEDRDVGWCLCDTVTLG